MTMLMERIAALRAAAQDLVAELYVHPDLPDEKCSKAEMAYRKLAAALAEPVGAPPEPSAVAVEAYLRAVHGYAYIDGLKADDEYYGVAKSAADHLRAAYEADFGTRDSTEGSTVRDGDSHNP